MSDPQIRASDAERDATIERLRFAAGEGRLTLEELADRIEAVSGTTVTRGDLAALTADLPAAGDAALTVPGALAAAGAGGAGDVVGAPGAAGPGASVGAPAGAGGAVAPPQTEATSFFGDLRRDGRWIVPGRSRWRTVFGDVKLDLREARVGGAVVEVDASTVFGDVELLVPEGVLVDVRSRAFFGDVRQQAGGDAPPGAPRVVLTGGTVFGDVRVKERRLSERMAAWWKGRTA
jgi:hypothetical protein